MKRTAKARSERREAAQNFDKAVGENIRNRRVHRGLSQQQLADEVGVDVAQISRYESGTSSCEPYTLSLIAGALGCKAAFLMQGADGK